MNMGKEIFSFTFCEDSQFILVMTFAIEGNAILQELVHVKGFNTELS